LVRSGPDEAAQQLELKGEGPSFNRQSQKALDDPLPWLIERSLQWVWEQREFYRANGRPLSDEERNELQGYYNHAVLDVVRVASVERLSDPPFLDELRELGTPTFEVSRAAGITFVDCLVIQSLFQEQSPAWFSILFHELVHVVQHRLMGPQRFIQAYVLAWAESGHQYHSIPYEEQAYRLEARFKLHGPPFPVEDVVRQELKGLLAHGAAPETGGEHSGIVRG